MKQTPLEADTVVCIMKDSSCRLLGEKNRDGLLLVVGGEDAGQVILVACERDAPRPVVSASHFTRYSYQSVAHLGEVKMSLFFWHDNHQIVRWISRQ